MEEIIDKALGEVDDKDKLILDGFPRHIDQAKWMVEKGLIQGNSKDTIVIVDVPESVLIQRFAGRGRADDTPTSIDQRLKIYNAESSSIFDYFADQNIKSIKIDGSGKVGEIHDKLIEELSACKLV
jgi:adenylate kinase family enzyme